GIDETQARNMLARLTPHAPPPETPVSDVSAVNIATLPPGAAFADASELIDAGLPAASFRLLEPYVAALPNATLDINVNTASDTLLRAYLPNSAQAGAIRSLVSGSGHMKMTQFGELRINDPTLRVTSEFFRVRVRVRMNGQLVHLTSTLQRSNGSVFAI